MPNYRKAMYAGHVLFVLALVANLRDLNATLLLFVLTGAAWLIAAVGWVTSGGRPPER